MMMAGPVNSKEEMQGYEQIALLTELRNRLNYRRTHRTKSLNLPPLL